MSTLCSAVTVTSGTSGNSRRRSGGSGAVSSLEDTGEKAFPDQLALAASRRGSDDRGYSRRGSVIQSRSKEAPSKGNKASHFGWQTFFRSLKVGTNPQSTCISTNRIRSSY
ncbi:uncharacterized protein Dsimw501_GD28781 [Drosophila simulans]|nr:uncharacterized protein Dsimw501_GD28781 [Drosophila simulans]